MVKKTTQSRTYSGIKLEIYSTIFLYSKEEQIFTITIKNKTSLPLIREVIDKLKDTKYFNKLDLIQE